MKTCNDCRFAEHQHPAMWLDMLLCNVHSYKCIGKELLILPIESGVDVPNMKVLVAKGFSCSCYRDKLDTSSE